MNRYPNVLRCAEPQTISCRVIGIWRVVDYCVDVCVRSIVIKKHDVLIWYCSFRSIELRCRWRSRCGTWARCSRRSELYWITGKWVSLILCSHRHKSEGKNAQHKRDE